MKTSKLSVSFIIPNWNGKNLLTKHIQSVLNASNKSEVIVVDDASQDGSVDYLKKFFPTVKIVAKSTNSGFSGTVNAGSRVSTGDVLVLLNTDVEPEENFLDPLLDHFSDPNVFAVGCLEKSHEKSGIVLRGRGEAGWHRGFYIHERGEVNQSDTAWVSGGSGAFRRVVWSELGGMDEIYNPFYWEDIDLSYRARKAGYKIIFEPKSIVHHYHELGAIKSSFSPTDVKIIAARNQFTFIWKNVTDPMLFLNHIAWLPIRIIQSLLKGDVVLAKGFVKALSRLHIIFFRRKVQSIIAQKLNDTTL